MTLLNTYTSMPPTHTSEQALYTQRPDWLISRIDENYANEHSWPPPHFALLSDSNGTEPSYQFDTHSGIHDTAQLAAGLRTELDRPLRVLDVGTGVGITVAQHLLEGDDAQGISAFDYRTLHLRHPLRDHPGAYIVGNAENMHSLDGLAAEFDIVMSRRAVHHFVDPLGTFEQMTDHVAPGGLLCVDAFDFTDSTGISVPAAPICEAMEEAGFTPLNNVALPEAKLALGGLPAVVWRRAAAGSITPVRFPISYEFDTITPTGYRLRC